MVGMVDRWWFRVVVFRKGSITMSGRNLKSAGQPDTARPTIGGAGVTAVRVTLGGDIVMGSGAADPLLTSAQCAERVGVRPATWRGLVRDGYAPRADDAGDLGVPPRQRRPRWRASSVERFLANRPGQGRGPRPSRRGRHYGPVNGPDTVRG